MENRFSWIRYILKGMARAWFSKVCRRQIWLFGLLYLEFVLLLKEYWDCISAEGHVSMESEVAYCRQGWTIRLNVYDHRSFFLCLLPRALVYIWQGRHYARKIRRKRGTRIEKSISKHGIWPSTRQFHEHFSSPWRLCRRCQLYIGTDRPNLTIIWWQNWGWDGIDAILKVITMCVKLL